MVTACYGIYKLSGYVHPANKGPLAFNQGGNMKTIASAVCFAALASGVLVMQEVRSNAASKPVTVEIKNAKGQSIGTAVLTEATHGVKIKLDVKGLPPGEHSLHIHQNAKCEPPDFKSAGPHFNGTAIVIHAVASEASSSAPPRIACGVIKPE